MKPLLFAFLLFNALLTTLWACGSGPKPEHYGVAPKASIVTPVPQATNSVAITPNKPHP